MNQIIEKLEFIIKWRTNKIYIQINRIIKIYYRIYSSGCAVERYT